MRRWRTRGRGAVGAKGGRKEGEQDRTGQTDGIGGGDGCLVMSRYVAEYEVVILEGGRRRALLRGVDADGPARGEAERGGSRKRSSDVTGNLEHRPRTTSRLVYLYARRSEALSFSRVRVRSCERASTLKITAFIKARAHDTMTLRQR